MKAKNRNLAGNVAPMMPRQNRGTHLTRTFALTAAAAFCFSAGAMAQFNASLTGTVEDNTGASIPGATVTLVDNGTQQKRTVTSGGSGSFSFTTLPPGNSGARSRYAPLAPASRCPRAWIPVPLHGY